MFGRAQTVYNAFNNFTYTYVHVHVHNHVYVYVHACMHMCAKYVNQDQLYVYVCAHSHHMHDQHITLEIDSRGFLSTMGCQRLCIQTATSTDRVRHCITSVHKYTKLVYLQLLFSHISLLYIAINCQNLFCDSAKCTCHSLLYTCMLFDQSSVLRFEIIIINIGDFEKHTNGHL